MKLTNAQKIINRVNNLYGEIYATASPVNLNMAKNIFKPEIIVSDSNLGHCVFDPYLIEEEGVLAVSNKPGLYEDLLNDYPGILSYTTVSLSSVLSYITSKIFYEKRVISALGKSMNLHFLTKEPDDLPRSVKVLTYDSRSILLPNTPYSLITKIQDTVRYYDVLKSRRYDEIAEKICKDYYSYCVLSFIKKISEKSCAYAMSNMHIIDVDGEVSNYIERHDEYFARLIYYIKHRGYRHLEKEPYILDFYDDMQDLNIPNEKYIKNIGDKYVPVDSPYDKEW